MGPVSIIQYRSPFIARQIDSAGRARKETGIMAKREKRTSSLKSVNKPYYVGEISEQVVGRAASRTIPID
jgi:hypothetical protein